MDKVDPVQMEKVFLDAMKSRNHERIRPVEVIKFRLGDYQLVGRYEMSSKTDEISGKTEIFFKKKLVWQMTYKGKCPKGMRSFLREALKRAYDWDDFFGGRGPFRVEIGKYEYRNFIKKGLFEEFFGEDMVIHGNTAHRCKFKGGVV